MAEFSTIGLVWDQVSASACGRRLPCVLVDIVAAYAQLTDLEAIFAMRFALHYVHAEWWSRSSFTLNFDDPATEVDYVFTIYSCGSPPAIHRGSVCMAMSPTLAEVFSDCTNDPVVSKDYVGKKWIPVMLAHAATQLSPRP